MSLILLYLVTGLLAGLLAGLFGIGGGLTKGGNVELAGFHGLGCGIERNEAGMSLLIHPTCCA